MEHFIVREIRKVDLVPTQFAYTPSKGCTVALVNFLTDAALKLDKQEVNSLLLDYSNAFDNMNH